MTQKAHLKVYLNLTLIYENRLFSEDLSLISIYKFIVFLDNYKYTIQSTCSERSKIYATLLEAKSACSSDISCSGILNYQRFEYERFQMCHGDIYNPNGGTAIESVTYIKEAQYGRQWNKSICETS